MKQILPIYLFIVIAFTFNNSSYAQGVAVNTDGSTAAASAMLDVKSLTKGVLIPRVNLTSDVTSPVTGLLVFQTSAPAGFYYYSGASWLLLQNSGNVIPAANGGAGAVNGILKANGSGTVSQAVAGTDYLAPNGSAASLTGFPTLNQNTSGNAATATLASTVTTNANLTGDVTSSGNATTIANTSTGGTHIVTAINNAGTTGTIAAARLGTGATTTNFLRGDGTYATPAGGSSATALTLISSLLNLAKNPTVYFFNPNAGVIATNQTSVTYIGTAAGGDLDNFIVPFACTVSSLTVTSNTIFTGTGSDNTVFTVYKNGAAQGMTCTVSNTNVVGNVSSATDNTHTFTLAAGDRISISFAESNANVLAAPYISYSVVLKTQ